MYAVHRLQLCLSIALNALCAGGIFIFPLLSPALAAHSKLSQPQLTTIVLAGMMSQYTVAALVGSVIDRHGPSLCSLIAATLFSCGFGAFAFEIYITPDNLSHPSQTSFYRLVFFFLLAGLGTVFGYFSSLFAASKAFPNHLGLASGTSMALFGLSPLFLTVVATNFFMSATTGLLNVSHFMSFLALLMSLTYTLGYINLRQINVPADATSQLETASRSLDQALENTPLLVPDLSAVPGRQPSDPTVKQLLKVPDFWLLAIFCVFILGASEMVISNIGTILMSLPTSSTESTPLQSIASASAAHQVKFISIANTFSRIAIGPLADFVSPVATYLPTGAHTFPRKHRISRFAFLSGSAVLLFSTFIWMVIGVTTREHVWALSLGVGVGYSAVFTILPSIISFMWGMQNLGRNFGLMMYAPFTGTPLFSYLYAFISVSNSQDEGICEGRSCWQKTFGVASATSIVALFISFILWRRWIGRI